MFPKQRCKPSQRNDNLLRPHRTGGYLVLLEVQHKIGICQREYFEVALDRTCAVADRMFVSVVVLIKRFDGES